MVSYVINPVSGRVRFVDNADLSALLQHNHILFSAPSCSTATYAWHSLALQAIDFVSVLNICYEERLLSGVLLTSSFFFSFLFCFFFI
jgi:hypothetical protein